MRSPLDKPKLERFLGALGQRVLPGILRPSSPAMNPVDDRLAGLPGEEVLREGIADLIAGRESIPACLAAIARPRLERAGLVPADLGSSAGEPELLLYTLLGREPGDPYGRYNALLRRLVSYERALDGRARRTANAVAAAAASSQLS